MANRKLGFHQLFVLDKLYDNGTYSASGTGNTWVHETHSKTVRILDSLHKRGLVRYGKGVFELSRKAKNDIAKQREKKRLRKKKREEAERKAAETEEKWRKEREAAKPIIMRVLKAHLHEPEHIFHMLELLATGYDLREVPDVWKRYGYVPDDDDVSKIGPEYEIPIGEVGDLLR